MSKKMNSLPKNHKNMTIFFLRIIMKILYFIQLQMIPLQKSQIMIKTQIEKENKNQKLSEMILIMIIKLSHYFL